MTYRRFYGVDTSKASYDFCSYDSASNICDQGVLANCGDDVGQYFEKLIQQNGLHAQEVLVCIEDTGVYLLPIAYALHQLGLSVWIVDAYHLKNSMGRVKGKTDKLDAQRIAKYAKRNYEDARLFKPAQEDLVKLKSLIGQRKRMKKAIHSMSQGISEERQFQQIDMKECYQITDQTLVFLQQKLRSIEEQMDRLIKKSQTLSPQVKIIQSVPGFGPVNARNLVVITKGFTQYTDGRTLASLVGVAPFPRQSGKRLNKKPSTSSMARRDFKATLTMAAMSLIGGQTHFAKFYARKIAEGKKHLVALNAMRNKLLHTACACLRDGVMYQENFHLNLHKP